MPAPPAQATTWFGPTTDRHGSSVGGVTELPDRELLAHAVEESPDGVVIVDEAGVIVYANRKMLELTGARELTGRNVDELVPTGQRGRHAHHRSEYGDHPTARPMGAGLELTMACDDGTQLPVEISLSPFDSDGSYVTASVRDISARQRDRRRIAAADQQLALLAERERIGRDLHDVVLQRLYGMGLSVQAVAGSTDEATAEHLEHTVAEIDRAIREVRTIVFTLGSAAGPGSLGQSLTEIVGQAARVLACTPSVQLDGPVDSVMSDAIRSELVASMREAIGNVARHAAASNVEITISIVDDRIVLEVADDGVGPPDDPAALVRGHGLANLRRRAEAFGGDSELRRNRHGGTTLQWSVPF